MLFTYRYVIPIETFSNFSENTEVTEVNYFERPDRRYSWAKGTKNDSDVAPELSRVEINPQRHRQYS